MKLEITLPDDWIECAGKKKPSYWIVEQREDTLSDLTKVEGSVNFKAVFCIYPKNKKKPRRFAGEIYLKKSLSYPGKKPEDFTP
jgi:hypothetical protein